MLWMAPRGGDTEGDRGTGTQRQLLGSREKHSHPSLPLKCSKSEGGSSLSNQLSFINLCLMAPALLLQGISHLFSSDISSPVIKFSLLYNREKRKQFPHSYSNFMYNNSLNKMMIVWAEISQNCSGTQDCFQITLKILLKCIHIHYSCLLTCDNSLHHKPMNFHCHKCISPAHPCSQGLIPSASCWL